MSTELSSEALDKFAVTLEGWRFGLRAFPTGRLAG